MIWKTFSKAPRAFSTLQPHRYWISGVGSSDNLRPCRFYATSSKPLYSNIQTTVLNGLADPTIKKTKVCVVGSGNWGSAIAKIVGSNCQSLPFCEDQVNMWVFEEMVDSRHDGTQDKLSKVINERHENVKYLPDIALPENVVAVPDLDEACKGANLLIFVVPHQFLPALLPTIKNNVDANARGVSLIKGLGKCMHLGPISLNTHA